MYRVAQMFVFFLLIVGTAVCQTVAAGTEQNNEFPLR